MSLATSTDLQSAIADWLARNGDSIIAARAADFVTLCESRLHYGCNGAAAQFPSEPLRIRAMETARPLVIKTAVTGGTVGGTANAVTLSFAASAYNVGDVYAFTPLATNTGATTLNVNGVGVKNVVINASADVLQGGELVAGVTHRVYFDGTNFVWLPGTSSCPLPSGFLAERAFYLVDGNNQRSSLAYDVPEGLNERRASTVAGRPRLYTIENDCLRFAPDPDGTYYGWMNFYKKFISLNSVATNWLMTNKPDVYLYGSLLEAAIYLRIPTAPQFYGLYMSAVNGLVAQDQYDRHAAADLVIRTDTGNP